jgi:ammonia channel protein AmtB
VKCISVKCSENHSSSVSIIIRSCIDRMKFAAYMAVSFIIFLHIVFVPCFVSLYIWLYFLHASD